MYVVYGFELFYLMGAWMLVWEMAWEMADVKAVMACGGLREVLWLVGIWWFALVSSVLVLG